MAESIRVYNPTTQQDEGHNRTSVYTQWDKADRESRPIHDLPRPYGVGVLLRQGKIIWTQVRSPDTEHNRGKVTLTASGHQKAYDAGRVQVYQSPESAALVETREETRSIDSLVICPPDELEQMRFLGKKAAAAEVFSSNEYVTFRSRNGRNEPQDHFPVHWRFKLYLGWTEIEPTAQDDEVMRYFPPTGPELMKKIDDEIKAIEERGEEDREEQLFAPEIIFARNYFPSFLLTGDIKPEEIERAKQAFSQPEKAVHESPSRI